MVLERFGLFMVGIHRKPPEHPEKHHTPHKEGEVIGRGSPKEHKAPQAVRPHKAPEDRGNGELHTSTGPRGRNERKNEKERDLSTHHPEVRIRETKSTKDEIGHEKVQRKYAT